MQCEFLEMYGLFIKYKKILDLACRGFIKICCKGEKMDSCSRKIYRQEHGAPPGDDMMPRGQLMPKSYQYKQTTISREALHLPLCLILQPVFSSLADLAQLPVYTF